MKNLPSILKPNFDLFRLYVGKNGALTDQLLPTQRTGLGALRIDSLESFHLLSRVTNILPIIKLVLVDTPTTALSLLLLLLNHHSHYFFWTNPTTSPQEI